MQNLFPTGNTFGRNDYGPQGAQFVMTRKKANGHTRLYWQQPDGNGGLQTGKKDLD